MPGQFCCGERADDGPAAGGRSYMWCVRGDWCAYLCVAFVYLSLISIDITTTSFCIYPLYGGWQTTKGKIHIVFFQFIVFMVVYSHLAAAWQDPGLTPKDKTGFYRKLYDAELRNAVQAKKDGDASLLKRLRKVYCLKCESPKPAGAHHCSTCNRCVRQMDHHCPWINNCVGERNWKSFLLFLCYVTIGTGYAIVINILRAHQIITSTKFEDRHSTLPRNTLIGIVIWCVLSFVFAIFFFAFVMCMFYDQYEAFTTGVPGVDAMQLPSDAPRKQGCLTGLRTLAMANEGFSLRWFIPVPPSTLQYKRPQPPITAPPPSSNIDGDEVTARIDDKLNEPLLKETMMKEEAQYDAWAKKFDDLGLSKPKGKEIQVSSAGEDGEGGSSSKPQTRLEEDVRQDHGRGTESQELEAVRAEMAEIEREMDELVKDIRDLAGLDEDKSNESHSVRHDSDEEEDDK